MLLRALFFSLSLLGTLRVTLAVGAAPAGDPTCDFTASNDTSLTAILANSAVALSGKTICLSGLSFGTRVISKVGLTAMLTITSKNWNDRATLDGWAIEGGTNKLKLDHLNFQMSAWPRSDRGILMLGNSGGSLDSIAITNNNFHYGYGPRHIEIDPTRGCAFYPEICQESPKNIADYLPYAIARDGSLKSLSNLVIDGNSVSDTLAGFKFQVDGGAITVTNNGLDRIYDDCITLAIGSTAPSSTTVNFNTCMHQWEAVDDISGGHADFIQFFGDSTSPDWPNITIMGNRQIAGISRGISQGIFLAGIGPDGTSHFHAFVVGNLISNRTAPQSLAVYSVSDTIVMYNTVVRNEPGDKAINPNRAQMNIGVGAGGAIGNYCVGANITEFENVAGKPLKPAPDTIIGGAVNGYMRIFNGPSFGPDGPSSAMMVFAPRSEYVAKGAIGTIVNFDNRTVDIAAVHKACGF